MLQKESINLKVDMYINDNLKTDIFSQIYFENLHIDVFLFLSVKMYNFYKSNGKNEQECIYSFVEKIY